MVCMLFSNAWAQLNELPQISYGDFAIPENTIVDSSTHAVVILEKGRSDIQVDDREHALRVVHRYAVRIKILDQEGFDMANYVIPLYKIGNSFDKIRQIRARTHYIENGIQTVQMKKDAVFLEEVSDFVHLSKFTLPDIRENCIIDIEYELHSPDIFNYRTWAYQDDIPKLYSEYIAIIPGVYKYNVTLQGFLKLADTKSRILKEHFALNGRYFNCSEMTYIMKNIPAFQEESYMLAPKNYKAAINFELIEYYRSNGMITKVTKEWKDVNQELLSHAYFGRQINRTSIFNNILPSLYGEGASDEEKARKIFNYIKQQIKWNKVYGFYAQYGVKEVLDRRVGNIGDINLALIAACNAAGIKAYPVLLSTRENGLPSSLHPVIADFNYLVAQVEIGDSHYFLDASEPQLPFGLLPLRCINGNGRIIYSIKSSDWIKLENKTESSTHFNILGSMDENGQFVGKMSAYFKGLDAFNRRNYIQSFSSLDNYIEERMNNMTTIQIQDGQVVQLDSLDKDLVEQYDIKIDFSDHIGTSSFTFNPILINRMMKNPFNLEERKYDVDVGSKQTKSYAISVQFPAKYQLERQPEDISFTIPNAGARYTSQSQFNAGVFMMKQQLSLNKAIYGADEYFFLKELYSRIIQHQTLDVAFKINGL